MNRLPLTQKEKYDIIIQIGEDRVRNLCSLCHKKMDITNYHIQLCKSCRSKRLEVMQEDYITNYSRAWDRANKVISAAARGLR